MLSYLARMIPVLVRSRVHRDDALVSRLERTVRLADVDVNGHMNQAAYALVMEEGRLDLVVRSGALARFRERGLNPVVAEQRIVYRRELKPRQRFVMDTRLTGFEGRLVVFSTHLCVADRVHALGEAKLLVLDDDGVLSAEATQAACEAWVTEPLTVRDWRAV